MLDAEVNPATGKPYRMSVASRKRISDGAKRKWTKLRAQGLGRGSGGMMPNNGKRVSAYQRRKAAKALKANPNVQLAQADSIDYWASQFNAAKMDAGRAELDMAHAHKKMSEASSKLKELIDKLLLNP